jgi:hypothetical protein
MGKARSLVSRFLYIMLGGEVMNVIAYKSESFIVVAPGLSRPSVVKRLRFLFTIVCNKLECLSLARFCSL